MDTSLSPSVIMLEDAGTKQPVPLQADPSYGLGARVAIANPPPPDGLTLKPGFRLEILLGGAPSPSVQPSWLVVYSLWDSHTVVKKSDIGVTNNATPVVAIPAAVTPQLATLQYCTIDNRDATAWQLVVQVTDGTTTVRIRQATLQPGESLYFSPSGGWQVLGDLANYFYLPGRSGGQFAYGGKNTGEKATIRGNNVDANGGLVNLRRVEFENNTANPSVVGEIARNGTGVRSLLYHEGTLARNIVLAPTVLTKGDVLYQLVADDYGTLILSSPTSTGKGVKMPAPATVGSGFWFAVKRNNAGSTTNVVNVQRNAGETIDGRAADDLLVSQYAYAIYWTDGTNWFVLGANDTLNATGSGIAVGTSLQYKDIASIMVPPGLWELTGKVHLIPGSATAPSAAAGAVSAQSGNLTGDHVTGENVLGMGYATASDSACVANWPVTVPASAPYYVKGLLGYSTVGTAAFSGNILARRVG